MIDMRQLSTWLLAGTLSLVPVVAAAQDSTIARPGDATRVIMSSNDSLFDGRLSWVSADSFSVWHSGAGRVLPLAEVRSVQVRRRPEGYVARTVITASALGVIGGILGAHFGACHRAGAPPGGVDFSCDTPDAGPRVFGIMGGVAGASVGWAVQAFRERSKWIPARIVPR